jgi:DnaJ-class molecular chaperone
MGYGHRPADRRRLGPSVKDPYKALGVQKGASQDEIRRAYRKLAKQHHPDLNPGNAKAEETFKGLTAANELLSNPKKRGQFDRGEIDAAGQQQAPRSSYRGYAEGEPGRRYGAGGDFGGFNSDNFADIFGSAFGGSDERYTLKTDFLAAFNGATQRLTLPDGRTLDAKIPPGTVDGKVLRLRGQGSPGRNGGAAGDALIEIHIAPHPFFRRDGQDVRMELPVTVSEAVLGGSIEAPTPAGDVRVRIPPGSDSGSELRLRGRGMPKHAGQAAGNLYATLRVVIGPPDEALKAFLETWKPEHATDPRQSMELRP